MQISECRTLNLITRRKSLNRLRKNGLEGDKKKRMRKRKNRIMGEYMKWKSARRKAAELKITTNNGTKEQQQQQHSENIRFNTYFHAAKI